MARKFLMAEDVAKLADGGRLVVDEATTVSVAARELALAKNITITEEPAGAPGAAAAAEPQSSPGVAALAAGSPGAPGTIIVTAVGVNRPGVLAELSTAIGQLGGDIQDLSQRITGGYFNAILIVDIRRSGQSFAAYREALKALAEPSDYVVTIVDERVFTAMHRLG
ncbi:MAG: ACT domain-containing protein [Planctomycetota bacterium]